MERKTLTVKEAAEALGIGQSLAWKMVYTGQLPCLRLGRRTLVPRQVLDTMLTNCQIPKVSTREKERKLKNEY